MGGVGRRGEHRMGGGGWIGGSQWLKNRIVKTTFAELNQNGEVFLTGCLYASRGNIPFLMADVRVTYEGMPGDITTPAKILRDGTQYAVGYTRVCRKIFILSDRTAIATAGDENCIRKFVEKCRERIDDFDKSDRPMSYIGHLADEMGGGNPNHLMVIGAHVRTYNHYDDLSLNYLNPGYHFADLPYFGRCVAIGSGAEELLREIRLRDENIRAMPILKQQQVYAQIFGACSAINAQRMGAETNPEVESQTWGHFLEYAYFNFENKTWERQRGQIYLYIIAGICEEGVATAIMLPRFVAYNSGELFGRISAFSAEQNPMGFEWLLDDISQGGQPPPVQGLPFWAGWKPGAITLTVIMLDHDGLQQRITQSLNDHELINVTINISEDKLNVYIDPCFFDRFVSEMLEYMGFFYQSWDDLNEMARRSVRWPVNVNLV